MTTPARLSAGIFLAVSIFLAGCMANRQPDPSKVTKGDIESAQFAGSNMTSEQAKSSKARDLVCGMDVDPKSPDIYKTQYECKTYYFCSKLCKKNFEANPEEYVHKGMADQDMHGNAMAK